MSKVTIEELIEAGVALVGMPYGTKSPVSKSWNQQEMVISTPQDAQKLYGKNIGIAHAYCSPTPTCAIDIDHLDNAQQWLHMHDIDLCELVFQPSAVLIRSGKPNSLKLLYRIPSSVGALETKKIIGPDGKSAVEFRCASKDGKTVQDVLPPSRHPDGYNYQWGRYSNPQKIPTIPTKLLAVWQLIIHNTSRVAFRRNAIGTLNHLRPETPRQIATIEAALKHINADCSYETWRNVVWAILSTGWLCAEDIAVAWSQTEPHRFDSESFWSVANSFIPGHSNQITVGSIYHHARLGGWNG
jgi:putative DNA primase/helicase